MSPLPFAFPKSRISGLLLRAAAVASDTPLGARALQAVFASQLGIDALAELSDASRGELPWDAWPIAGHPPRGAGDPARAAEPVSPAGNSWPPTVEGWGARLRRGELTPREACDAALAAASALTRPPAGGPLLAVDEAGARRDADAATARLRAGQPRGPLDGVPVAVKEEMDVAGLPTGGGTSFLGSAPARVDATVVARLRAAGAVVLGHTAMTEYGLSPLGANPQRAMPRNPHGAAHLAGGSSTGSAVAVATGLVPLAVGADGGGSIRIPSALCGVFGIKPTFGRVSRAGSAYSGTMDHVGPIASSVAGLAAFLDATAGLDERDGATRFAPVSPSGGPRFADALARGASGLVVGVVDALFTDADDTVAHACRAALSALERAGARLVSVDIPLAAASAAIGYLSIGIEALACLREARLHHHLELGDDLTVTLNSLGAFAADDYLDAQRLRATLRRQVAGAFAEVDLLAMPSTLAPAPAATDAEMKSGFLDAAALGAMTRTTMLANLTGLPAASAPVGRTGEGLPVGLQLVGDAFDEATVLAALATLERDGAASVARPAVRVG